MFITIDKEWFEKNKQKLLDNFDGGSGEEECYQIDTDIFADTKVELPDGVGDDNTVWLQEYDVGRNVYINIDYRPTPEQIAELVENSMDDLKGEALTKVIETVVKKLNKLRSFIESIKGL